MITTLSNTGTYHQSRGQENQDALHYGENAAYVVIALADGVSACREAARGAQIASRALTELLLKKGGHFLDFEAAQAAEYALSHVLYELRQSARADDCPVEALSSTIAGVLLDKKSGRLLCLSLGDSLIMGVCQGKCRALVAPGDASEGCCVTTTRDAAAMMEVRQLDAAAMDSVVICSDGAWKQLLTKDRLRPEAAALLHNSDHEGLRDYLLGQECFDDCSFISLDMRPAEGRTGPCQDGSH